MFTPLWLATSFGDNGLGQANVWKRFSLLSSRDSAHFVEKYLSELADEKVILPLIEIIFLSLLNLNTRLMIYRMSNYAWKSRKFALKWCPFQQWIAAIYYAGEIWKRCFDSENASTVFRQHYAGKKLKTQLPLRLRKLGQEIMIFIVTFSTSRSISKCFSPRRKRKDGVFEFRWVEERFRTALFSRRISVTD